MKWCLLFILAVGCASPRPPVLANGDQIDVWAVRASILESGKVVDGLVLSLERSDLPQLKQIPARQVVANWFPLMGETAVLLQTYIENKTEDNALQVEAALATLRTLDKTAVKRHRELAPQVKPKWRN